ncbi:hypothetical protein Gotur_028736 [Gossypium turneri]
MALAVGPLRRLPVAGDYAAVHVGQKVGKGTVNGGERLILTILAQGRQPSSKRRADAARGGYGTQRRLGFPLFTEDRSVDSRYKRSKGVVQYLLEIKTIFDELAIVGAPISSEELMVEILSGHTLDFKEVSASICTRDTRLSMMSYFGNS